MGNKQTELQCIICARNSEDGEDYKITEEHIIPECIGGWITVPFLCKSCNNDVLGSAVEAKLKQNAYIVAAIDKTGLETPDRAFRRANISLEFENGITALGRYTEARQIKFVPTKQDDGSLIVPEDETINVITKQVKRYEKEKGIDVKFDPSIIESTPYDILTNIPGTDISFIKRQDVKSTLLISNLSEPIPFMIPASIAFETIAGFSYSFIIHETFDPFRDWLQSNSFLYKVTLVNPINSEDPPNKLDYEPHHYLRFSMVEDGLVALVVLFGQLVFSVFMGFNPPIELLPDGVLDKYIVFDLKTNDVSLIDPPANIVEEDNIYLEAVYHLANCELRLKRKEA